jgi:hypothetical protein
MPGAGEAWTIATNRGFDSIQHAMVRGDAIQKAVRRLFDRYVHSLIILRRHNHDVSLGHQSILIDKVTITGSLALAKSEQPVASGNDSSFWRTNSAVFWPNCC